MQLSSVTKESKRITGKVPKKLTTDGLKSYATAFEQEFASVDSEAVHVKDIQIGGQIHNNKMEKMNGEVRDREKVMRGLKVADSPIIKGFQIYHNFIRPHEGLNGATPADRAGITVEGENKWQTIIQNAQHQRRNREDSEHQ